jgi:UDP-N-acetylmuramoylalanine--D-glutamate ligase
MKYLILGFGKSGRGAALFLLKRGAEVFVFDDKLDSLRKDPAVIALEKRGAHFCNSSSVGSIAQYEKLVVSPGFVPSHFLLQEAQKNGLPIIGELELGLEAIQGKCLAITGSNGKTTTTLLCAHILKKNGWHAEALGNVGVSLTSYLAENPCPEVCVVEVSSFQLERMQGQFFDAACLINITPDHMDRYASLELYAAAKIHLQDCLKKNAKLYLPTSVQQKYATLLKAEKISAYDEEKEDNLFRALKGKSKLNEKSNLLAAYHLCATLGITEEKFSQAYEEFQKPPHRMEFVAEINGVSFYNDSKATNVESVLYAINAIESKIILIAGGYDKGLDYHEWKSAFQGKVKTTILIGDCQDKIAEALKGLSLQKVESFRKAIYEAYRRASKGDVVLLSPGCSSYDMFKNYEHRGSSFKAIVHDLQREETVR